MKNNTKKNVNHYKIKYKKWKLKEKLRKPNISLK